MHYITFELDIFGHTIFSATTSCHLTNFSVYVHCSVFIFTRYEKKIDWKYVCLNYYHFGSIKKWCWMHLNRCWLSECCNLVHLLLSISLFFFRPLYTSAVVFTDLSHRKHILILFQVVNETLKLISFSSVYCLNFYSALNEWLHRAKRYTKIMSWIINNFQRYSVSCIQLTYIRCQFWNFEQPKYCSHLQSLC